MVASASGIGAAVGVPPSDESRAARKSTDRRFGGDSRRSLIKVVLFGGSR
jgi:hypothetical protein